MNTKRLRFVLFAIPVCLISVLIIGAQRSHPANAGGVIDPTCVSSLPCIEYDNNGSGPGIRGVSLTGNGSNGITRVNSTSVATAREGVFGNDMSTSGSFNRGVRGLSTRGTGVLGESSSGPGISGNSTSGVGVMASSTNGLGLSVLSSTNIGANVTGGFSDNVRFKFFPALSVVGTNADLIDACPSPISSCYSTLSLTPSVFEVSYVGNVTIASLFYSAGFCHLGCAATATSGEKKVRFYTPQESLPTVEDFGEAQLVNGQAYVHIDSAFSNTIDPQVNYLVFLTPEGPSRGLYVTEKSMRGFAVRENPGGKSTLVFSYRIVAKPFGEHPVRLQMITVSRPGTFLPTSRIR